MMNTTPESLSDSAAPRRKRIAVIGAGAGGIATAYFLQGSHDVEVFEARNKIGGHSESVVIDYQGQPVTVDLGAQFFHPATHPIYVTLLEEIGLYDPDHPDADQTFEAPGSLCIFPTQGGAPTFASTRAGAMPLRAITFALYSQYAREAVTGNLSWEITLDSWVKKLPLPGSFKSDLLHPWLAALIGTSRANALRASARSILQTFALAFPATLFGGRPTTFNSSIGLQGNLQRLLDRSPGTVVNLGLPVTAMSFSGDTWSLDTLSGRHGPYDAVVLNAPPGATRELVRALPWAQDIAAQLDAYEYFESRILIHTDPAYVHRDRANWAVYSAGVTGIECEGSAWEGGLHEKLPSGGTVDIFKSWALNRRAEPANILYERRYKHPLITPEAIRAARALHRMQGRNGLHFGGQYTTASDMQETAVFSAMRVTEALAPGSATLASLKARLAARGRAGASYEL